MVYVLISTFWLAIMTLVLVGCRAAARGDTALTAAVSQAPIREHVTVHQRTRWQAASPRGEVRILSASSLPRSRPPVRGSRCLSGSRP